MTWPTWPSFNEQDQAAVLSVIKSNQLFAASQVQEFEARFADYIGVKFARGVGNATQGLHLALAALDIGHNDEVIVPNYSFISTASCVLMQNAVPVFADLDPQTLAPSVEHLEYLITDKTKAIIVTHLWGFAAKIDEIFDFCQSKGLPLIEDASHAHGATYHGKKLGSFSTISVFSLHQRKNLPVGDGGICCTNDHSISEKIFRLRSFGDVELSYNYRMTEFAAALGISRLSRLDNENSIRRENADYLASKIDPIPWLSYMKPLDNCIPCYHTFILLVDPETAPYPLDIICQKASQSGIPIKRTWQPLHLHPHFNPLELPARGLPWKTDQDVISLQPYASQSFPIGDFLIKTSILQLDIHPGVTHNHLDLAANFLYSLSH